MIEELVPFTIKVTPAVAEWLRAEAKRQGPPHVRPETIAAIMVELAVEDKRAQRAQRNEQPDQV